MYGRTYQALLLLVINIYHCMMFNDVYYIGNVIVNNLIMVQAGMYACLH